MSDEAILRESTGRDLGGAEVAMVTLANGHDLRRADYDRIRRAAYLECAEIAEREADAASSSNADIADVLYRLATRYHQMAEESGG